MSQHDSYGEIAGDLAQLAARFEALRDGDEQAKMILELEQRLDRHRMAIAQLHRRLDDVPAQFERALQKLLPSFRESLAEKRMREIARDEIRGDLGRAP